MKNWGIKTRILFLALVPFSLIVTLISLHFIVTRIDDLDQALQERGKAIARQLAPACEYGVFSGNREFLSRLARSALWEKDIRTVSIADAEGNILAHASHGTQIERVWPVVGRTPPVYTFKSPIFQSEVRIDDLSEVSREGYAGTPAARDRQPIGMVSIDISGSSTILQQNRALGESLLIMMLGLIFTALVALRMARGVIRPIQSLTSAMTRIKSGDLDQRVAEESGGELGSLEKGINAMAETLERSKKMEKKMADDALYLEKIRAQVTLESIGDGVITTDDKGKVVYMNPVASEFTGWDIRTAEGLLLKDIFKTVDEMSSAPREYPLHLCLRDGNIIRHDSHHLLVRKDGYRFAIQDSAAPIRDRDGKIIGAALVFHDMTELQHMARRMAYLASHDPLTGLINRREFESRLQQVLDSARLEGRQHAICYLDLDQFKIVNDTCGHVAGDELLKQLAQHLHNEIRQSDVLARLGGDEFGVILENCSVEMAQQVAELLRQSIKSFRFAWQDRSFDIGASIGLVPITADSGSLTDIMSVADSACYVAKDRGRNCIHVYQEDDAALAHRQGEMQWVQRLKRGLDEDSFKLYCQAIVPLSGKYESRPDFYEILVRFNENGGDSFIIPTVFMPAAERYHLMPTMDRRILTSALSAISQLNSTDDGRRGAGIPLFSINLSGQSLCDDKFLDFVITQLEFFNVAPENICFEITETAAIANLTRAKSFITSLKDRGCMFALDDFGSGLSSFGYLKSLPVDYLKIAGSFIQDIASDAVDHAMVEAINQVGHIMGLITVAESVEDDRILEKIRQSGIDYGQGFGIAMPVPVDEVIARYK